jgi:hypothetical protein
MFNNDQGIHDVRLDRRTSRRAGRTAKGRREKFTDANSVGVTNVARHGCQEIVPRHQKVPAQLNETFGSGKEEYVQVCSPVAKARNVSTSNVLERLNGSTDMNDKLAELRRQIVGQVSQIEVPPGHEHQQQWRPRRFG